MKSELQRYSMEIEDVPYSRVPQSYIKEYEDTSGEWVYADVAISTIKELEKQNEMMYTTLKKLMEMRHECFIPNEGDWWDNMAQEAITLVEGEQS
jgi:hypothetical protein